LYQWSEQGSHPLKAFALLQDLDRPAKHADAISVDKAALSAVFKGVLKGYQCA
jgi:hypothetical protein